MLLHLARFVEGGVVGHDKDSIPVIRDVEREPRAPARARGFFPERAFWRPERVPSPGQPLVSVGGKHRAFLVKQGELVSRGAIRFLFIIVGDRAFHCKCVWCGFRSDQLGPLLHDVSLAAGLAEL